MSDTDRPDMDRLQELAFDFYQRYILLQRIEKLFHPAEGGYRVLDVGGHTAAFWPGFPSMAGALIPDAGVTVVDMIPQADLRNYVRASGMQLPFRDNTFDLVCSLDTLEHVPAEARADLLSELVRVTRDGLYVAFPFNSPSNRWAENVVREYADVVVKDPIPALLEHLEFGLPDRDHATSVLRAASHPLVQFEQGNTDIWLLMMLTYHTLRMPGTDFVHELNRRFNMTYASQDWGAPAYRTSYLLSKRQSLQELEALKASFRSGDTADLGGVLAVCQLLLSIAHNGRVLVDKDRHIGNLESDLNGKGLRLASLNSVLQQLQQTLGVASAPNELRELASRAAALVSVPGTDPASELMRRIGEQNAQLAGYAQTVLNLTATVQHLTGTVQGQDRRAAQMNALTMSRLRDVEAGVFTNRRAVQAIYDSRIWKALSGLGGLVLRVMGRGGEAPAANPFPGGYPAAAQGPASTVSAENDEIELECDYPSPATVLPVRDVVEIRGWALAQSGIDRVLVQIDNDPAAPASGGVPRDDVWRNHVGVPGAENCGYRFFWDTSPLPEGPCTVRITAVARSGKTREMVCRAEVNHTTPPDYGLWIARNEPTAEDKKRMREEADAFERRPSISIAVPVYKTEPAVLTRCLDSVKEQLYANWELCIADDGSRDADLTATLADYAGKDTRVRTVALEANHGISGATNAALKLASGEYVAFLDHDDELADFALWEVVRAINEFPDTELFYSDEDKIDERGRRYDVFFKPGWSPDLFLSCNYVCHFVVMKRSLLERLGGIDEKHSGSQDYEFLLRASEQTQEIRRIPKVLYHWRAVQGSTAKATDAKPKASGDGRRALTSHLARTAPGAVVEEVATCRYRVHYPIAENPRVTILLPTGGNMTLLRTAMEDVLAKTTYKNYDILLIDNSRAGKVEEYAKSLTARAVAVQYMDWRNRPFNFSKMNNDAAKLTDAPYILFLNDDMTVIAPEWMSAMLEHAQRKEVGAVGAQLWYPHDVIQHAGVLMGIFGNTGHAFKGLPAGRPHYFDFPNLIRNCSAVTAACLLMSRAKFFEAGAFDEVNLAVAFQDVDLCLKLLELGYRNVYTPYAKLYHHESVTKTEKIPNPLEDGYMKTRWAKYIADDPYYNPNLVRSSEDYRIAVE